jgi:hypothetical protein
MHASHSFGDDDRDSLRLLGSRYVGVVRDNARQLKFKAESTGFE